MTGFTSISLEKTEVCPEAYSLEGNLDDSDFQFTAEFFVRVE